MFRKHCTVCEQSSFQVNALGICNKCIRKLARQIEAKAIGEIEKVDTGSSILDLLGRIVEEQK